MAISFGSPEMTEEMRRVRLVEQLDEIEDGLLNKSPSFTDPRWGRAVSIHRQLDIIDAELAIDWEWDYEPYLDWLKHQQQPMNE